MSLVASGTDDDLNFVLEVLSNYHGEPALHETCKAIIEALPDGDTRLDKLEIILESTGTVSGEFGMVHTYERKKEEVKGWLNDQRSKVRTFAERYLRTLDRSIGAEQRRSEASYELRRRDWEEE